ncbi:MAG TPA: hypothetical protein VGB77_04375 [Abditibacteriaceae bacterium]
MPRILRPTLPSREGLTVSREICTEPSGIVCLEGYGDRPAHFTKLRVEYGHDAAVATTVEIDANITTRIRTGRAVTG